MSAADRAGKEPPCRAMRAAPSLMPS
jgi:hypothetical protein